MGSLNHARLILRLHHRLVEGPKGGSLPYSKVGRQKAIADVVADLWHLASRYGILWSDVESEVNEYLSADWEA